MPENKRYLIEIPGLETGSGIWDADKWERNKEAFMADYPDANVFELGDYDPDDTNENDQFMLTFEDDPDSSGVWDAAKWERNKEAFTADNPEAKVSRVRYVDYWGEQATANRERRKALEQPDAERNARLAEIGYYDDLSYGQGEFNMDTDLGYGLKPLSSAIETNSVSGETTYLDPRVQEFFVNDTAETERQAEIARLDAEYESNPSVIRQREQEAQMRAEQAEFRVNLRGEINTFMKDKVDLAKAGRGAAGKRTNAKYGMSPYIPTGEEAAENEKREKLQTSLKFLEKADIADQSVGKGFWGGTGDTVHGWALDAATQGDLEAYNEIGDILTALEKKLGSLKEENLTPEILEENLSPEDKMLILSFFNYNEAMRNAQVDMSRAYKGGKIFAESVPFMLEFLATGGLYKGAGRVATKGLGKAFAKWIAKSAPKTAARAAKVGTAKAASGLLNAMSGTLARTAVAPGTYRNMAEQSVKIEDGHLDRTKNATKAFFDSYIENLSEISGGVIGKSLGMFGLNPSKLLGKVSFGKIGQLLADNRLAQGLSKGVKALFGEQGALTKLGFNGIFEEVEEEYIGNFIREVTGVQPGALAEMHKDGNFGAMLIGFAPMTLFGAGMSAANMAATNIEAANLGKKLRETLGQHYTEDAVSHMMSLVDNAENADEVWKAIEPMAGALNEEETTMLYQYGAFKAQNKAMLFARKAQERQLADAKRAEIQQDYGRFWQEGEDGAQSVQMADLNDGRRVFVLSAANEQGEMAVIDTRTGETGIANVADIKSAEKDGMTSPQTRTWSMDAFLDYTIALDRRSAEQTRMVNERDQQIEALKSGITEGMEINLGTEGSPVIMLATGQFTKDGVLAGDASGNIHTIGWEQAADALGTPIRVKTDQDLIDEETAAIAARRAERRKKAGSASQQLRAALDETAQQTAEVVSLEERHIPKNPDGSVNETAFWEQDPEGYAQWNDEQNKDGGADTMRQLAVSKMLLAGVLAEAQKATQTSNPAERKAAEQAVREIQDKIDRYTAIEQSYVERAIAPLRERAMKWNSLTGASVILVENEEQLAEISGEAARQSAGGARVRGFAKDGRAYIYLPGVQDAAEIDAVFVHEAVSHQGLKGLLGQKGFDELCEQVWQMMSPEMQNVFINYPGVNGNRLAAADEYIAHIAERIGTGVADEAERTIWEKLVDLVRNILRAMGIEVGMNERELSDLLHMAYADLAKNLGEAEKIAQQNAERKEAVGAAPTTARQMYDAYIQEGLTPEEVSQGVQNDFNAAKDAYDVKVAEKPTIKAGESTASFIERKKTYNEELGRLEQELRMQQALMDEIAKIQNTAMETAVEEAPVAEEVLEDNGIGVDGENGDARLSIRFTPTAEQREMILDSIMSVTGRTREEAERWLDSETSLAAMVGDEMQYLDYPVDSKYKAIKDNSDYPQGTVDFNNICRKRLPFTKMFTRLQRRFPNRVFTADELADIRGIMSQDGLTVACGLCYVEDRRQMVGEVANSFITEMQNGFADYASENATKRRNADKFLALIGEDTYVPSVYELTTQEGADRLYNEHRGIWEAFQAFNNARGQQSQNLLQGYAEYKREILSWSDKKVKSVNDNGGLRIFSYSDFEAHHLLDIVQIIKDCAAKGVKIQGYTKVPAFARAVANTGIKLNRSLIPLGDTGIVDGQLAFDPVEGIDINDPDFLESNDNVGNILIGINDVQIRMAMADPRIHFIIPYHARQKENIRRKLNVGEWVNYISTQNERNLSDGKRVKDNINIYTEVLTDDMTNDRQFVEKYLQLCREKGRIPKFDQFLNRDAEGNYVYTPGYYKFLVDFKLFDENGNILPQRPVVAEFDDAFNMQILEDYVRGEKESTGDQMNETYDKIVEAIGLDESAATGEDIRFSARTDEQRQALFDAAKAKFGLTDNFNVAGYMLPDGSLLDFSEANDGGDPNQRSLDHREIEGIIMDEGTEYDSRWMYLADFMNEGAIRLLPEYAGINLMKTPTKEQRQRLMDFIYKYNGEVILEIADERLNNVAYVEYGRRTSPSRIFRDIDGYFNEGIVPEQDTRFSFIGERGAAALDKAQEATTRLDNLSIARQMEEAGRVMHSVPVTEEMKASVMEGQVMFSIVNDKTGSTSIPDFEFEDDLRFSLSKNNRKTISGWLNKRADLTEEAKNAVLDYIDQFEDATLQLAMGKWFTQNVIRLPEDAEKCMQAVASAKKAKMDPMKFSSPMEIIERHGVIKSKEKPIDPDTVSTLRRAKELPDGIVIYDVEESEESRQNMRRIINTHYGKNSSPWCLLQGDENGNLTAKSAGYWNQYNAYPKQVAFKDGRLLAFGANDRQERIWWDRMDKPHDGIPVPEKIEGDRLGRSIPYVISAETGEKEREGNIFRRTEQDGVSTLTEWASEEEGDVIEFHRTKDGEEIDGFTLISSPLGFFRKRISYVRQGDMRLFFVNRNLRSVNLGNSRVTIEGAYVTYGVRNEEGELVEVMMTKDGKPYRYWNIDMNVPVQDKKRLAQHESRFNEIESEFAEVVANAKTIAEQKVKELVPEVRFSVAGISPEVRAEMDVIAATAMVNGNYMLAPNGQPTKLTVDQWAMVRTRNFINWFGDWINDPENASKVVDENGEPMVVYHGTLAKNLTRFDKDFIGSRYSYDEKGFFFISRESIANDYATPDFGTGRGAIIPAFINLKNPLFVDQKWAAKNGLGNRVFKDNDVIEFWDNYQTLMVEESQNNDGVIISDGTDLMVVAFEPSQIKSATDNTGEFSESEDIRFSSYVQKMENDHVKSVIEQYADQANQGFDAWMDAILVDEGMDYNMLVEGQPYRILIGKRDFSLYTEEDGSEIIVGTYDSLESLHHALKEDAVSRVGQKVLDNSELLPEEMQILKAKAVADGTYLKAPNGEPSKLMPSQWLLVRTQEFMDWFGDWIGNPENASKIIDSETGEPMLVYHGASAEFNVFKETKKRFGNTLGKGYYFASSLSEASFYANTHKTSDKSVIKRCFLKSDNPLELEEVRHLTEGEAQSQKDGIIVRDTEDSSWMIETDIVVVFDSNQIKSAEAVSYDDAGNVIPLSERFNAESSDIRFSAHRPVGGNRGYVGYSMSKRAAAAREEGRYPKTDFRKEYGVTSASLDLLVYCDIISGSEWHHTSMYGNKTHFYGWYEEEYADIYTANKKEIDALAREYKKSFEAYRNSGKELHERLVAGEITPQEVYELGKEMDGIHWKKVAEIQARIDAIFNPTDNGGGEKSAEEDVLFSAVTDPMLVAKLESEPKVKVYRAMQLIDGKLYPPMSAYVDGVLREPSELGQWEQAEENTIGRNKKDPSKVDLEQGKGDDGKKRKTSGVLYNPYFHTSLTPLNDQFSGAQTRSNLVIVETEVPQSELTSGYQAEGAANSVGMVDWHSGPIAGVLAQYEGKGRQVILSRWAKPIRIVPESEIADIAMKLFEGTTLMDVPLPSNVFTPALREELERRGMKFVETTNNGRLVSDRRRTWSKTYGKNGLAKRSKEDVRFSAVSTPVDDVIEDGLVLSVEDFARLAGDIFSVLPESVRNKVMEEAFRNGFDMQSAIFQIPARLAEKMGWDEADKDLARAIRDKVQDAVDASGVATERPLTSKEAMWMLYNATQPVAYGDLIGEAGKALAAHNLGFDPKSEALKEKTDAAIRYSAAGGRAIDAATNMYNYEANLWINRLAESWLDMHKSVIALQKALADASGKPIESWEDIVLALNQLSSKSYADKKKYMRDFLKPLWDTVLDMVEKEYLSIEQIERYMMLKHGLERNDKLAKRDAREFYRAMYGLVAERMKSQSHAQQVVALSEAKKRLADIDAQIAAASSSQLPRLNEARARAQYDVDVADLVLRGDEQQNEADLQAHYDAIDNKVDPKYREFRKKDYGGLSGMFVDFDRSAVGKRSKYKTEEAYQAAVRAATKPKFNNVEDVELAAENEVAWFEKGRESQIKELWQKINAATKETLRHQHASGMITTEQYDAVRDMFEYYVPLRGFADNTAEDMYSYYMSNSAGGFAKPLIAAKGRKTRAESPLGWIGTMAESAIQQDNKNDVKMRLYYALLNRPDNGLLSMSETWYEYSHTDSATGKKVFVPAFPPATGGVLSADQMRAHMDAWEAGMKAKQAAGQAYKASQKIDLKGSVIFQDIKEEKEHIIQVRVAGKEYSIIVNGNPRAAQAINGLLNPDAKHGPFRDAIGWVRRGMSSLMTSLSPLFWVSNYQRDILSSTMRTSLEYGWKEAWNYFNNRRKAWRVASYIYKYEEGTLGDSYYENLYKEFAENGGITGYTVLATNKEYEKMLEDYAKHVDQKVLNFIRNIWDKFMGFGEAIEQVSRFAAYITARESGKSIEEAVSAAKEVSVNFNRKGSASPISWEESGKLRKKNGNPLNRAERIFALILSAMPGAMKETYFFFNASVQATSSTFQKARKSPGKTAAWAAFIFGTSLAVALINNMLADDDDEEYLDLPDYLRQSNILIPVGDGYYIKWSIPQEVRPFYSMADILVSKIKGKTPHKNAWQVGKEMALTTMQWLPMNPFDAEDPILAFVPDWIAPEVEAAMNKTAFGGKIYDDMMFKPEAVRENVPAYRKATSKTGKVYVEMSELLNAISGGDEVQKGAVNINPAVVEHLVEGHLGGMYDLAKMVVSLPMSILRGEDVELRDIPFVNKVVMSADETNMHSRVNEAFYYYQDIATNAKRVEKEYRDLGMSEKAASYRMTDDWRIHMLFNQYEPDLKEYKDKLKDVTDEEEKDLLLDGQNVIREQLINDIASGKGPDPVTEIRLGIKAMEEEVKRTTKPYKDADKRVKEARERKDHEAKAKAQKERDSIKRTDEYKSAKIMEKEIKELKKRLDGLGSESSPAQRDSVIGEIERDYEALIGKIMRSSSE